MDDATETAAPDAVPSELILTFIEPVDHLGKFYTGITLRAPTWGEMKGGLKQGSVECSTHLASILGGVPLPALNKLDARDGWKIDRFFSSFM